jgi:hypothetical protein
MAQRIKEKVEYVEINDKTFSADIQKDLVELRASFATTKAIRERVEPKMDAVLIKQFPRFPVEAQAVLKLAEGGTLPAGRATVYSYRGGVNIGTKNKAKSKVGGISLA